MAFAPRRRVRSIWRYFRAERRTLRQGSVALLLGTLAAFVAGIALGSISHTLEVLPDSDGLIATLFAIAVAYYVAIFTVRFGFDPDNTGVALITNSMDLAGVISFLLVLSFLGVTS